MAEPGSSAAGGKPAQPALPPAQRSGAAAEARLTQEREQKVLEYQAAALALASPLLANVALVNGDLMLYAGHVRRVLVPALRAAAQPQELPLVSPALEGYFRLARQVERLSCLIDRLQRAPKPAATAAGRGEGKGD